jgi:hypothetical protein
MIGDRLDTDILMGIECCNTAVLVKSGVTTEREARGIPCMTYTTLLSSGDDHDEQQRVGVRVAGSAAAVALFKQARSDGHIVPSFIIPSVTSLYDTMV